MVASTTLQTLLFTDLVASTKLKRELGDREGSTAIARHDELFRACLTEFGGVEQNNPGDGFFATFDVPSAAVRCALAFQRRLAELDLPRPLHTRIGIHVGEASLVPGAEGHPDKLLGLAVDIAGRVMGLSGADQILLTRPVFDSARQHVKPDTPDTEFAWRAHGAYLLKGIDEPIEIFEAGVVGAAPLHAPADTERSRRAIRPGEEATLGWRPAAGLSVPSRGDWELEQRLGAGGFGEIWLARNARTAEQRAFKFCFDAERLQTLKRELTLFRLIKQTLGNRPDITRLYEVQFDEAPYFLELEYTSGGTLGQWVQPDTPLATRLEIVAQVADALAAAHSVGVIHKDIKPSNVLIDTTREDHPQARLTDFGIGQLLDRGVLADAGVTQDGFDGEPTFATDLGSRTGTRIYMAPELMTGRPASIASDVYSMGVMLYQLVVGELDRPLAQGWEADIEDGLLREDIAACVAGDPEARLRSADLLAERLRTLEERRQERDRERDQAQRDARKRRVLRVSLAASLVLLLVAATAVLGYFRAEAQRRRAEDAEQRARQRFAEVRGLANAVLFEFDDQLRDLPGSLPARRFLVEQALRYLDSLPTGEADVDLTLEQARGYVKVAQIQGLPGRPNLGDRDGALANLNKAHALVEPLHRRHPDSRKIAMSFADVLLKRGALLTVHDRDESRSPELDRAARIVSALLEEHPEDVQLLDLRAQVGASKAIWHHYVGSDQETVYRAFEESIAIRQALREKGASSREQLYDLAVTHSNFGASLSGIANKQRDLDRAFEQYETERRILEELASDGPTPFHLELALARNHLGLGRMRYFQGQPEQALEWYRKADERLGRLRALHPSDIRTRRFFATACRRQAQVHNRNQDSAAALQQYLRAIEALTELPPGVVVTNEVFRERGVLHEQAGLACVALGRKDDARKEFDAAVADFQSTFDAGSADFFRLLFYPNSCRRISEHREKMGDWEAGLELLRRMDQAFGEIERQQAKTKDVTNATVLGRWRHADFCRELGLDADREPDVRRPMLREAIRGYQRILADYDAFPEFATNGSTDNAGDARKCIQECEAAMKKLGQ